MIPSCREYVLGIFIPTFVLLGILQFRFTEFLNFYLQRITSIKINYQDSTKKLHNALHLDSPIVKVLPHLLCHLSYIKYFSQTICTYVAFIIPPYP